jgi:lipoxygenase
MRLCLPGSANRFERAERERYLFAQQQDYTWVHAPGQPPFCKGLPPGEELSKTKERLMALDLVESVADIVLAVMIRLFKHNDTVASFKRYYPIRPIPAVAARWMQDKEFARQRLDGINPFLIKLATEIPEKFPVTDDIVGGVLPEGTSLAQLLAERRLFLLDYEILQGLEPLLGRFCVAPICLFWKNDIGRLMPLAIQLGQSPAEAKTIFTPKEDHWTWLMARTYVQSADGTYHEVVAHLTRTHLAMETFWVAACRTLPPQHPLHALLKPHFTGTVAINYEARNKLIAPGGPIDESIAIGAEGSLTLVGLAYDRWTFESNEPVKDLENRGLLNKEVMPHYHYRDDALALYGAIRKYVYDLLRVYYTSDGDVQQDTELQAWARELVSADGGRVKGLPVSDGAIGDFDQLHSIVTQVIYTCSVEHAAVNNGQYAQFGWIPNTPGAMYLPPPTDHEPRGEANFVYALPDAYGVGQQLTLVHLLSEKTLTPLGDYPDDFFNGVMPAQNAIDRFRGNLDDIGRAIQDRNRNLEVPYKYLEPWLVGRSIAI